MNYAELFENLASAPTHGGGSDAAHLSEAQRGVVTAPARGKHVVIAGPGAGKTTVLVERIAYLLANGADPAELLVCAFTRAAAEEMQQRLAAKMRHVTLPFCGTMHSLAFRLLGGQQWLLKSGMTLISEDDQLTLLHSLLVEHGFDEELSEKEVLLLLQRAQEGDSVMSQYRLLAMAWEEQLEALGYVDFIMMLKRSLEVPNRRKFRFVVVDEGQDLTPLQLRWLEAHSHPDAYRFLVGDDDQGIYAFRGSAPSVLALEIERGSTAYQLQDNWRSRAHIITAAAQLIGHNSGRVSLPQHPNRPEGDVTVARFKDELEELAAILTARSAPMVLCRTRAECERFHLAGVAAVTIHEAKGREWPFVWVSGLEQGMLPHALGNLEEERRLFYVAITRARDRLTVSVRDRVNERPRQPSQFVREAGLG